VTNGIKIDMTQQLKIDDGDVMERGRPAYTMSNENGDVSGCYVMVTQEL